jgi:hypothetical protein
MFYQSHFFTSSSLSLSVRLSLLFLNVGNNNDDDADEDQVVVLLLSSAAD